MSEDTTEEASRSPRLGLSTPQVVGSALAAMSAAVIASWLGTAGTIIGAAVGSVCATVGSATYSHYLQRSAEVARRTAHRTATRMRSTVVGPVVGPAVGGIAGHDEPSATQRLDAIADEEAAEEETPGLWQRLPWGRLIVVAVAIAIVGLAGITLVEALTGKPVSAITGGHHSTGTTVGHLVGGGSDTPSRPRRTPSPTPSPTQSSNPSPSPSQTSSPTPTPTPATSDTPSPTQQPVPSTTTGAPTVP